MPVVTIGNQKGGSGKTTVTAHLAACLAQAGARVLAIDMDPQAQLAGALGAEGSLEYDSGGALVSLSIADAIAPPRRGRRPTLDDVTVATPVPGLYLVPGSEILEDCRRALEGDAARGPRVLSELLQASSGDYDYVFIDTAPKLDILLDNALAAADYVLAVLAPERQQAEPLTRFIGRVEGAREYLNPHLVLAGVLFNKADYDWAATQQMPAMIAELGLPVMKTVIPKYATVANAYGDGPVVVTKPNHVASGVWRSAAAELVDRLVPASA